MPHRLAMVRSVASRLGSADTVDDVAGAALEAAGEYLGAVTSSLWLVNEDQTALVMRYDRNARPEAAKRFPTVPLDSDLPGAHVVRTGEAIFLESLDERDMRWPEIAGTPTDSQSLAVLPLVANGEPLGVVSFGFLEDHGFDAEDRDALLAVADQCAIAIDRARVYERERARTSAQFVLATISRPLHPDMDWVSMARHAVDTAATGPINSCVLYIREGDIIRRVAASSQSRPDIAAQIVDHYPVPLSSPGTTAAAIRTGEPQPVPALTPEAVTEAAPQPGLATVMAGVQTGSGWAFPLKERGVPFGAMVFLAAPNAALDKDTVQLAREAADRTANLLVSASAFAEQRAALEALHEVLLPRAVDEIGGLQIVARYVPLSTRGAIGGDWWDALLLPSGNVALAVGDVAGHGVPSAAVMGQLRNALRMALVSYGGPGESLDALSTFLDWTHPAAHCTAIAATADAAAREVTWSSAGHPPPLLVSAAGEATFVEKPAQAPLGVTGERIAKHVEHVTRLEPGATLLLYTDGLVEGRHRDLDAGLRALAELASDALTMESLDAGADRILASLVDRPDDDVCLLAARLA